MGKKPKVRNLKRPACLPLGHKFTNYTDCITAFPKKDR